MYDTYLQRKVRENADYQFITEELWTFLKSRYDVDQEIKRFYTKANNKFVYSTMTSVESRFQVIPIMLVKAEDLLSGSVSKVTVQYTQMSKTHNYSNFKKRLVDILEEQGMADLKQEQIRMWLSSGIKALEQSFRDIKDGKKSERKETGKQPH